MPRLANKNTCTGCMACMNACHKGAISFVLDEEGFLMPAISNDKCVDCHLCENICPEIRGQFHQNISGVDVYAGWNETDRQVSSSGGAFSSVARFVLDNNGYVYGATLNSDFICRHIEVDSIDGLDKLRGSKYIQSSIDGIYQQVKQRLMSDNYVLFSGTPCQVSGLKSFLNHNYEKLITIDLICHGVPSNALFQAYIEKLKKRIGLRQNEKLSNYEFRRRDGWGEFPSISTTMRSYIPLYGVDALYMYAFERAFIIRRSCYNCHYSSTQRVGDFTIGDFWGLGHQGVPFKYDMSKGVSLLLVNSNKGRDIMSKLGDDNFYVPRTLEEAVAKNYNLTKTSPCPENREVVINAFFDESLDLHDIENMYHLVDKNLKIKIRELSSKLGVYDFLKKLQYKVR